MNRSVLSGGAVVGACCLLLTSPRSSAQGCGPTSVKAIQAFKSTIAFRELENDRPLRATDGRQGLAALPVSVDWVRGEFRLIDEACARGRDVEAVSRLEQVEASLEPPRKPPARSRRRCRTTLGFSNVCTLTADARGGNRKMTVDRSSARLSAANPP